MQCCYATWSVIGTLVVLRDGGGCKKAGSRSGRHAGIGLSAHVRYVSVRGEVRCIGGEFEMGSHSQRTRQRNPAGIDFQTWTSIPGSPGKNTKSRNLYGPLFLFYWGFCPCGSKFSPTPVYPTLKACTPEYRAFPEAYLVVIGQTESSIE